MQYPRDTLLTSSPTNLSLISILSASKKRFWCFECRISSTKFMLEADMLFSHCSSDGQLEYAFWYWMFDFFMFPEASTIQIASGRKSVKFDIAVTRGRVLALTALPTLISSRNCCPHGNASPGRLVFYRSTWLLRLWYPTVVEDGVKHRNRFSHIKIRVKSSSFIFFNFVPFRFPFLVSPRSRCVRPPLTHTEYPSSRNRSSVFLLEKTKNPALRTQKSPNPVPARRIFCVRKERYKKIKTEIILVFHTVFDTFTKLAVCQACWSFL